MPLTTAVAAAKLKVQTTYIVTDILVANKQLLLNTFEQK